MCLKTNLRTPLAMLLAIALVTGCASQEPWETESPREAVEIFITALYFERGDLAWHFLTPATQKELESRAKTINDEAGGAVIKPQELVSSVGFIGPHQIKSYDVQQAGADDTATVVVTTQFGSEHTLSLIRVDSIWRVDKIAIPPIEAAVDPGEPSAEATEAQEEPEGPSDRPVLPDSVEEEGAPVPEDRATVETP